MAMSKLVRDRPGDLPIIFITDMFQVSTNGTWSGIVVVSLLIICASVIIGVFANLHPLSSYMLGMLLTSCANSRALNCCIFLDA